MDEIVAHDTLEEQLRRCGSNWDAAQTHGLLTGRLAVAGTAAAAEWLEQILEDVDMKSDAAIECRNSLQSIYRKTFGELSERLSEYVPLLPADSQAIAIRIGAVAHWSEGFLHGLVSRRHSEVLKKRLGEPPLADIIKDILQVTRADVDYEIDDEDNETAFVEIVEYLRVVAQLSYEELTDIRKVETGALEKSS